MVLELYRKKTSSPEEPREEHEPGEEQEEQVKRGIKISAIIESGTLDVHASVPSDEEHEKRLLDILLMIGRFIRSLCC